MYRDGIADNLSMNSLVGDDPDRLPGVSVQHPVEQD